MLLVCCNACRNHSKRAAHSCAAIFPIDRTASRADGEEFLKGAVRRTAFLIAKMEPMIDSQRWVIFLLLGLFGSLLRSRNGLLFGIIAIISACCSADVQAHARERVRPYAQRDTAARDPFHFMGMILVERSGMAEDPARKNDSAEFGTVRGGLADAGRFRARCSQQTTGVVEESVHLEGPDLRCPHLRYGYERRLRPASSRPSGTLAINHPPSLVLIVMGRPAGRSVGDMYRARLYSWPFALPRSMKLSLLS